MVIVSRANKGKTGLIVWLRRPWVCLPILDDSALPPAGLGLGCHFAMSGTSTSATPIAV